MRVISPLVMRKPNLISLLSYAKRWTWGAKCVVVVLWLFGMWDESYLSRSARCQSASSFQEPALHPSSAMIFFVFESSKHLHIHIYSLFQPRTHNSRINQLTKQTLDALCGLEDRVFWDCWTFKYELPVRIHSQSAGAT